MTDLKIGHLEKNVRYIYKYWLISKYYNNIILDQFAQILNSLTPYKYCLNKSVNDKTFNEYIDIIDNNAYNWNMIIPQNFIQSIINNKIIKTVYNSEYVDKIEDYLNYEYSYLCLSDNRYIDIYVNDVKLPKL